MARYKAVGPEANPENILPTGPGPLDTFILLIRHLQPAFRNHDHETANFVFGFTHAYTPLFPETDEVNRSTPFS